MASSWRITTLQEIADDGGYGFVDGPFGSNLPASCYVETGIPVIRGSNLSLGLQRFDDTGFVFVSEDTAERLSRSCCRPFDIVFTKKGTIGQTGLVPASGKYERYLISSNQMKLSVSRKVADPLFVYYYVSSPASREKILRDSEATGVPKTNLTYLRTFPISLPPLPEQKAIARILGTLDDKIELNRRMNETLEATARAIFKSWFVDFDQVRAKMDGRQPPGMDADTAALFPDSFEHSNGELIPAGWRAAALGELAQNVSITYDFNSTPDVVFINTGDVLNGDFLHCNRSVKAGLPGQAKKTIQPNDILFSEIRPANRRFAFVGFDASDYVVSTKFMVIRSLGEIHPRLLYRNVTSADALREFQVIAESRSGTFPQITFDSV